MTRHFAYALMRVNPALLPLAMVAYNVANIVMVLMTEGRLKPKLCVWAIRYAVTVKPAAQGDLGPFLQVAAMPPGV